MNLTHNNNVNRLHPWRSPPPCFPLQQGQFTNPETPGYVGFANLPNQVHRKSVKKGFEFTLMVVGEDIIASLCVKPVLSGLRKDGDSMCLAE